MKQIWLLAGVLCLHGSALSQAIPTLPVVAPTTSNGLTAEYYRQDTGIHAWTQNEALVEYENVPNSTEYLVGTLGQGLPTQVKWSGYVQAPVAGYYRFSIGAVLAPYAWSGYPDTPQPSGWTAPNVNFATAKSCTVSIGGATFQGTYSTRLNRVLTDPIWFDQNESKTIVLTVDSTASEPMAVSLEWQHPAGFGTSTYEVVAPTYLTPALQRDKWQCQDFTAISTATNKMRSYWRKMAGAYGYRVYGGTTEQFSRGVSLTGGTVASPDSQPGSEFATFAQTGLTNGTDYYYTVKPAFANAVTGADTLGNESLVESDSPSTIAIPWDYPTDQLGNAYKTNLIVSKIIGAYGLNPNESFSLEVRGPDNMVYTRSRPDFPYFDTSRTDSDSQTMIDGTVLTPLALQGPAGTDSGPGLTTLPAHRGPYFRVRSTPGFIGVSASFTLPNTYLLANPADEAFCLMLGSGQGSGTAAGLAREVDAGYYYSRRLLYGSSQLAWSPYILGARQQGRGNPNLNAYVPVPATLQVGPTVGIDWRIRPKNAFFPLNARSRFATLLRISNGMSTYYCSAVSPYRNTDTAVMKRFISIAQNQVNPAAPGGALGYVTSGSYMYRAQCNGAYLRQTDDTMVPWTGERTAQRGSAPALKSQIYPDWVMYYISDPGSQWAPSNESVQIDLRIAPHNNL